MKRFLPLVVAASVAIPFDAWSYGSGGGSTSCAEPKFFSESPRSDSEVDSLGDFSFVASDTEPGSLAVKVNGKPVDVKATPMPNGDLNVSVHLASPISEPGRVQIAIDARSAEGCSGFQAYYVRVK